MRGTGRPGIRPRQDQRREQLGVDRRSLCRANGHLCRSAVHLFLSFQLHLSNGRHFYNSVYRAMGVFKYLKQHSNGKIYQFGFEDAIYYAPAPIYGDFFGPWRNFGARP